MKMTLDELFNLEKRVYIEAVKNNVTFLEIRKYLNSCSSCKPYIGQDEKYLDCMVQKYNSVFEDVIIPKIRKRYIYLK